MVSALIFSLLFVPAVSLSGDMPVGDEYTNSIGMKFVKIKPGTFRMGQLDEKLPWEILPHGWGRGDRMDTLISGDYDEKPVHTVEITKPFYMAVYEVTNFQYELFDYTHKLLRGKHQELSKGDDEAVIFVNWYQAKAFCDWLSEREGLPYRLPTEAEWEYACRAGTKTDYYTGDILPKEYVDTGRDASLEVGQGKTNPWGLYNMHGNVEEWCYDWYGPYPSAKQTDPVGYADGFIRVTRGGSHSTQVYALRSANRQGTVPKDKHWLIGFRVVLGEMPKTEPLAVPPPPLHQQNVVERSLEEISKGPEPDKPYFKGPRKYVNIPRHMDGPVFATHNHSPDIVACSNGDLLASWFSCITERYREVTVAAARLRYGHQQWDQASLFWDTPDRNEIGPAIWSDENGKIYWSTSLSVASGYGHSAKVMRSSTDSGATWSRPRASGIERKRGAVPGQVAFKLEDGTLVGNAFTHLLLSRDNGLSWYNPGGHIRGGHVCVVQLKDGRFYALTRGEEVDGMMAESISDDLGKSYTYSASEFPRIEGGQSSALLRLKEGPLFFASFADWGIEITDASGEKRKVRGLFAACSTDEGKSWPYKRLVTDDGPGRAIETTNGGAFLMGQRTAEPKGYMSAVQSPDGLIHLITSRQHYTFNLKWLMTRPPAPSYPEYPVKPLNESFDGDEFDEDGWIEYRSYTGGFNGKGQYVVNSLYRMNGLTRVLGKGSLELNATIKNISHDPFKGCGWCPATPGPYIWFRDQRQRGFHVRFDRDRIALWLKGHKKTDKKVEPVRYETVPESAKVKLIWNEDICRMRVFYGLNGKDATTELPRSKAGIYFKKPFSETTGLYLLVDHGSAAFENLEIKPISP